MIILRIADKSEGTTMMIRKSKGKTFNPYAKLLIFFLFSLLYGMISTVPVFGYDCNSESCTPGCIFRFGYNGRCLAYDGPTEDSGPCGNCGKLRRTCVHLVDPCNKWVWGDWACVNEGPCSPGQTKDGGPCGNGGHYEISCYQRNGRCQWDTQRLNWNCVGQGCQPGSTKCSGNTLQTCGSDYQYHDTESCDVHDGWQCPYGNWLQYFDYSCNPNLLRCYGDTTNQPTNMCNHVLDDTDGSPTTHQTKGTVR